MRISCPAATPCSTKHRARHETVSQISNLPGTDLHEWLRRVVMREHRAAQLPDNAFWNCALCNMELTVLTIASERTS